MLKPRKRHIAPPKARFTRKGISIVHRGLVICRVRDMPSYHAFMKGWNESANKAAQPRNKGNSQ